ncbi:RNA polymerase sigma factor [Acidicapsa acidisoli]|uniref:RNA polymerase sigma factor n=1 Tax=Acidicapsa acidisoli TaxID=1615681 RepID=UPI0021E0B35F|nr:RNA polymerase sigma factor [Acidicapsa acidisoli]
MTASVWFSKTPSARLGEENTADHGGCTLNHSIASDDQLLMRAQSDDQQAFVELCRRHSPMVKKRNFSIVGNQEDAEDALRDTLLRAYRYLDTFRRTCRLSTWLTSIGTITALMILGKKKICREGYINVLNDEGGARDAAEFLNLSLDPERLHSRHPMILVIRQEVKKLRPTLRSIIEQHYGTEGSLEESAKALDISVGAAKSRLMRRRKTLRSYLKRHGASDFRV